MLKFASLPYIEALRAQVAEGKSVDDEVAGVVREFLGSKAGQLLASCLQQLTLGALELADSAPEQAKGILLAVKKVRYLYTPLLPVGAQSPEADTELLDPLVQDSAPFEFPTSTGA